MMRNDSEQIRFGVICNKAEMPSWQKSVIQKLISVSDIEFKLVIFNGAEHYVQQSSSSKGLWKYFYQNYVSKKASVLKLENSQSLFEGVSKMSFDFISKRNQQNHLEDANIRKIENAGLDFIINFLPFSLVSKLVNVPRYGVWAYQFSNPAKYGISTPCFWEIYQQDDVTSAYLFRLTEHTSAMNVLHEGHLKTSVFYAKNVQKIYKECTSWPLKICADIRTGAIENYKILNEIGLKKIRKSPSNWQTFIFPFIQCKQLLKQGWKQLFFTDYWNIGIVHTPVQEFLKSNIVHKVHWFQNLPKSRFMADPFGIYFKEQLHIVYEDLKFEEGIGKTARFLYENNTFNQNEIVIEEEFHMSYPFLFEQNEEIYCIPETYQANQVRLYKALQFPSKWTLESVLIDGYAGIDSTLYQHDKTWFLFSTDKNEGPHFNLNIHFSDSVFGPWKAHPKNPVKTDIRSARPAGTFFNHEGELYRPSMDYSKKIEGRITINKVVTLSKHNFKEVAYKVINPFQNTYYADKVHTLSEIGSNTLVDGAKELFIFSNFSAFKYKMKRVINQLKKK